MASLATTGDSSTELELPLLLCSPLPYSVTATSQHFRSLLMTDWKDCWHESPCYQCTSRINPKLPDASFLCLTKEISKAQASVIFQLRSKHIPLRKHLHRIGKAESPTCALCRQGDEIVHHFVFKCPTHQHARFDLGHALGLQSKSLHYLLNSKKALKLLL